MAFYTSGTRMHLLSHWEGNTGSIRFYLTNGYLHDVRPSFGINKPSSLHALVLVCSSVLEARQEHSPYC